MQNGATQQLPEILLSVDGEFTGPIPGHFSMISLGAVAYTHAGIELSRFKINLLELPGSTRDPETMAWWGQHPEAWALATEHSVIADFGMGAFANWLHSLSGSPKLMGWPLSADFLFIYWYYWRFVGKPPFGYDGIDIKTYAMEALEVDELRDVSRSKARALVEIPDTEFSHDPLDDAAEQAKLFFALRNYLRSEGSIDSEKIQQII